MRDVEKFVELLAKMKSQLTTATELELVKEFEQQIWKSVGEVWKDIAGYEGFYKISNYGRIKSFKNKKPRILSTCLDTKNYPKVTLCKDGIQKTYLIHVLVATAFIPNPDNLPVVHHRDNNPHNNRVENLEWVTYKQNIVYAYAAGRVRPPYKRKNFDGLGSHREGRAK